MEETVKRENIYNVPLATALHTSSPAVTRSQQRAVTRRYFSSWKKKKKKKAAKAGAKVVQRNPTSGSLQRTCHDQTHVSGEQAHN